MIAKLTVVAERDTLDGGWVAECTELPGCVAQGDTWDQAIASCARAIEAIACPGDLR